MSESTLEGVNVSKDELFGDESGADGNGVGGVGDGSLVGGGGGPDNAGSPLPQSASAASLAQANPGYEIPARLRTLHNLVIQYASQVRHTYRIDITYLVGLVLSHYMILKALPIWLKRSALEDKKSLTVFSAIVIVCCISNQLLFTAASSYKKRFYWKTKLEQSWKI